MFKPAIAKFLVAFLKEISVVQLNFYFSAGLHADWPTRANAKLQVRSGCLRELYSADSSKTLIRSSLNMV